MRLLDRRLQLTKDAVAWTDEGRAELARYRGPERATGGAAAIAKSIAKQAPWWKAGLDRADATGKSAATAAAKWTPKTKLDTTKAAQIGSLLGAYDSDDVYPFIEHVLVTHGPAFALATMAQAWCYATSYKNPSWPKSTRGNAVWLKHADDEVDDDSSVSYGKARMAKYLAARGAEDPEIREGFRAALPKLFTAATSQQKSPLVYVAHDIARANELLAKLHANKFTSRFGDDYLPSISDDLKLVMKGYSVGLDLIDRFGVKALPFYARALEARDTDKTRRTQYLTELQNIRGGKTAKLVASYAAMGSQRAAVVAYFARYPELVSEVPDEDRGYLDSTR